jgi:hypothetical protein
MDRSITPSAIYLASSGIGSADVVFRRADFYVGVAVIGGEVRV